MSMRPPQDDPHPDLREPRRRQRQWSRCPIARRSIAVAAAAVAVTVAGLALLWPSSSASATAHRGSSQTPAGVGFASDTRVGVTENGVEFSFRVPSTAHWVGGGWERFSSISTDGGPVSLNKSIMGPQGAEAMIYWTSFPDGDYADPCAGMLNRSDRPIDRRSRSAQFRRRPASKLVRGLRTSPWAGTPPSTLCSRFARTSAATRATSTPGKTGAAVRCGQRRASATRSGSGSSTCTGRASSSQARPPCRPTRYSRSKSSRLSNRSGSASPNRTAAVVGTRAPSPSYEFTAARKGEDDERDAQESNSLPHRRLLHRDGRLVVAADSRGRPDGGGEWRVRQEGEQSCARRGDHRPGGEEARTTHERRSRALHYLWRDL